MCSNQTKNGVQPWTSTEPGDTCHMGNIQGMVIQPGRHNIIQITQKEISILLLYQVDFDGLLQIKYNGDECITQSTYQAIYLFFFWPGYIAHFHRKKPGERSYHKLTFFLVTVVCIWSAEKIAMRFSQKINTINIKKVIPPTGIPKKCNLTLAMSPTCHTNNTLLTRWNVFSLAGIKMGFH